MLGSYFNIRISASWHKSEFFDDTKTSAPNELDRVGIKPILRPCRECEHQRQS